MTDANNHNTDSTYDNNGNALTVTDASSHTVSYEYDKLNRLTKITYPDSSYEQFAYDDAGNKTSWRKQDANTVYYVYNDANLLTTIDYPSGTDTTFTYNGRAQRTQMVDAAGTTGYTYDSAGRLSTVTDVHGKTITYSYNDCGLRSGWTDQFAGTQSFSYNNMHALTSLTDRNSEQTSYQYDTGGRLSKITLANTAYTDYAYNNRNLVTSVTNKKSDATVISSYSYQYDSVGNPTKMTEANGDYTDYGYDNVYELTSEVMKDSGGSTIYSISWTYDNVGDRATQTKDGTQTSYTYNNMNQMSAAGNTTFTYDSNGNTATKTESQATTNYTWDYENRLTKIDNPSGDDYVYEYDGDGMRVRAGHDSGQGNVWDTRFYYDVGAPLYAYLFESDNDKTMTVAYTVGPSGNLISQRRSGSTYYHLYDRLGSTRQLLNSNQTTTDTYSYYAFGDVRTSSGSTTNAFKFVGRLGYYDDRSTDFQYLRARYYAPASGRFGSRDPLGYGPNAYGYARGAAAGYVDPEGLQGGPPPGLGRVAVGVGLLVTLFYFALEGPFEYLFYHTQKVSKQVLSEGQACEVCWNLHDQYYGGPDSSDLPRSQKHGPKKKPRGRVSAGPFHHGKVVQTTRDKGPGYAREVGATEADFFQLETWHAWCYLVSPDDDPVKGIGYPYAWVGSDWRKCGDVWHKP